MLLYIVLNVLVNVLPILPVSVATQGFYKLETLWSRALNSVTCFGSIRQIDSKISCGVECNSHLYCTRFAYVNATCVMCMTSSMGLEGWWSAVDVRKWSHEPVFYEKKSKCKDYLSNPPNGQVIITAGAKDNPMGVASYSCNQGYRLIGSSYRTCQPDHTWTSVLSPCCLDGEGFQSNTSCYQLSNVSLQQPAASQFCADRAMHLVFVETKEELDFIDTTLSTNFATASTLFTTGGTKNSSGVWTWSGTSLVDLNPALWNTGQPATGVGHGLFLWKASIAYKFGSNWLATPSFFMCEKDL